MALSQEKFNKLVGNLESRGEPLKISPNSPSMFGIPSIKEVGQASKEIATGFGKGLASSAIGTARQFQDVGQRTMAAVTPMSLDQVRGSTGLESMKGQTAQQIDELLKADNTGEKVGKVLSFITELMTPSGARKAVTSTASKVGSKVENLANNIPEIPSVNLSKVSDVLSPIEQGVETVLNPTRLIPKEKLASIPIDKIVAQAETKTTKLNNYIKQAEKAVSDYSQKTPLAIAGDKGSEALNILQNKLSKQQLLKKDALGKIGDKIVSNAKDVVSKFKDNLRDKIGLDIFDSIEGLSLKPAQGRASKIAFDAADNKLIQDAYKAVTSLGDKPTVRMIDDTVDALQDLLYKRKSLTAIPVNTQVESVLKSFTGLLNKTVKKVAGEQYSKANGKMQYMMDSFEKLNKALGAEGERGASLMKKLFSPTGESPRRLFAEIKKLTGIDLVEESTLAKFVMENVGDVRQAGLLEEIIKGRSLSPSSLTQKALDFTVNKLKDPIGKARRIINQPLKEAPIKLNTNQTIKANIAKGGDKANSIKNNAIPAIPKTVAPKTGIIKKTVDKVKNALGANIPNKQGGFVRLPSGKTVKAIDRPTKLDIEDVIAYLDKDVKFGDEIPVLERTLDKLLEKYEISPEQSVSAIKKRLSQLLGKTKTN